MSTSKIYVVPTPIGNLKDITYRAVETLKEVDFILCEDTRVTKFLLNHFEINTELISFNARMESSKINYALERITNGETCALVSDAGTPCISDPGVRFINAAIEKEIEIIGLPGPSAVTLSLSIAGLPTDSFVFEGFLPQKKGRQKKLKELSEEPRTLVLYESMYRIEKLLKELNEYMPERFVVICRELTKKFEESWRGLPREILAMDSKVLKGEFVVVIAPISWKVNHSPE